MQEVFWRRFIVLKSFYMFFVQFFSPNILSFWSHFFFTRQPKYKVAIEVSKMFCFFRGIWKFLKKGPKMSICTQTAHLKFSHNWKVSKISQKVPIFGCHSRCTLWAPIPFWGHFWDFFRKGINWKKILAKKNCLDFGPFLPYFKPKKAKNSDFWLFSPKNGHMQKFLWPKMQVVGAGWPKIFRHGRKISKSVSKNIFMKPAPFWGSTAPKKPKKQRFSAKNGHNAEFSVAENGGGRGGAAEKFSPQTKNSQKFLQKKNRGVDQVLGLCSLVKVQKMPKIGDFRPFLEKKFWKSVPGVCANTCFGAGWVRAGADTPSLSPKKILGS